MSIDRAFGASGPAGRRARAADLRPDVGLGVIGVGTLACPECDMPMSPGPKALRPVDTLHCPACLHAAPVRDFLSMATPSRPARVHVRLVGRQGRGFRVAVRRGPR